jgi:hypothetical protein
MEIPICLSPLKFYSKLEYQNRYRSFAYGEVSPLIVYANMIPPFQFVTQDDVSRIETVYLHNVSTGEKTDVTEDFTNNLINVELVGEVNVVTYPGIFPIKSLSLEGNYFLELEADIPVSYFSEIFSSTNNIDDCLYIEYSSPVDFEIGKGVVSFKNGFKFNMYLKSELGKPEYKFEEEATKRLGYTFIESQVSKKIYRFNTVIPEYLCDAMRLIRLCSNKKLISKGISYDMLSFDMDVDWQEQGDLASVTCEFQVDNIIVNLGGYEESFSNNTSADFNNDFNDDYK